MITLREAASGLLSAVESAIQSGDWKVDGSCDPAVEIIRLKNILAKPIKESFNPPTDVKEAFNLDRGCWERGCMAYDYRDGDSVTVCVDSVNMSQERVDETAKREHEPWPSVQCTCGGTIYFKHTKREWVGLTDDEMRALKQKSVDDGMTRLVSDFEYIRSIEAKLKEKNT